MTYRQLADAIEHMTEEQQETDVAVTDNGEVYAEIRLWIVKDGGELSGVLDVGHPVLEIG
jgi:predicted N-acetyltransferase YhbS